MSRFIWNERKSKISFASITQPIALGGLNVIDLETRIAVNYVQWIRRLTSHSKMKVSSSLSEVLRIDNITTFFRIKSKACYKRKVTNKFYSGSIRCFNPVGETDVRREPIWANNSIAWNITPDKRRVWEDAGVLILNDICKQGEDRLLSHLELNDKFGLNSSFLDVLGLRLAIPLHWRATISSNWQAGPCRNQDLHIRMGDGEPLLLANLPSKRAYRELMP